MPTTSLSLSDLDYPERAVAILQRAVDRSDTEGCWPWTQAVDKDGYGRTVVWVAGRRTKISAHRLAFLLDRGALPEPPLVVRHRVCGNSRCCRPDHLDQGTVQDNIDDTERMGRTARGERSGAYKHPESYPRGDAHPARLHPEYLARGVQHAKAKLSDEQVLTIRDLDAQGMAEDTIAAIFGVTKSTIHNIVMGKTWSHLPVRHDRPRGLPLGEKHWMAVLTLAQVRKIHQLSAQGMRYKDIAALMGVRPGTIGNIVRGESWAWAKPAPPLISDQLVDDSGSSFVDGDNGLLGEAV